MGTRYSERGGRGDAGLTPMTIAAGVFSVFYFVLGLLFLFVDNLPFEMSAAGRWAFGILLIVYSSYRLWRIAATAFIRHKRNGHAEEDISA